MIPPQTPTIKEATNTSPIRIRKATLSNIKTKKIQGKIDMQKMKQGQKMNMQIHNNTNSREKEVDQRYLKKKTYENAIDKGAKKDNAQENMHTINYINMTSDNKKPESNRWVPSNTGWLKGNSDACLKDVFWGINIIIRNQKEKSSCQDPQGLEETMFRSQLKCWPLKRLWK